jgi:Tfp pilus assembly protein PilN
MIRINLMHEATSVKEVGAAAGGGGGGLLTAIFGNVADSRESAQETQDTILKIALVLMPVIFVFGYRQYKTNLMEKELASLQTEFTEVQAELRRLDPVVKEIEKFQEEKRKLDAQLEVIKRLSKERLRSVKSLEALQALIPPRAWLFQLRFTDKNTVELEGFATDDLVISEFMQALERSIFFSGVNLEESVEDPNKKTGVLKKYKIICYLENA